MKAGCPQQCHSGGRLPLAMFAALGAVTLAGCGGPQEAIETVEVQSPVAEYVISGNLAALTEEGEVALSRSTAALGGSEEIARTALAHGEFSLRGELTNGGVVRLAVSDSEGNGKGSVQFILEPGDIEIEYAGEVAGIRARGGAYNQRVISSWQDGEAYGQALSAYRDAMRRRGEMEEGDERYEEVREETWDRYSELHKIRSDALRAIAESDNDPLASLYAVQMGGMGGAEALKRLDILQENLGEHPALMALRSRINQGVRMRATAAALKEGSKIKDFSSTGLDGREYHLKDSRAANDYTLVEFWASWCGPCRAENPNLIASYENYAPKGFGVFAFSLDEDREDWAEASEEDGIPWINTSDLLAYDSPVTEGFGVLAIPMNFLLDSEGVLVARNLRGDKLDEKLAELIDGIAPPVAEEEGESPAVEAAGS